MEQYYETGLQLVGSYQIFGLVGLNTSIICLRMSVVCDVECDHGYESRTSLHRCERVSSFILLNGQKCSSVEKAARREVETKTGSIICHTLPSN